MHARIQPKKLHKSAASASFANGLAGCDGSTQQDDAQRLRSALQQSLQNIGILAAFMCALAGQIYVSPPLEGLCYGQTSIDLMLYLEWFAMGFFFISITSTVVLSSDIEGVPDSLLIEHVRGSVLVQAMPHAVTQLGLLVMAVGYGVDLNERVGCEVFPFGLIAAPCFPVGVLGFSAYVKHRRKELGRCSVKAGAGSALGDEEGDTWALGVSWFVPWADLIIDERKA